MDLANFCRLCGKDTGNEPHHIFTKNEKGEQLIQIIKKYIPIILYRTDPLPKIICEGCYDSLNMHVIFVKQCVVAQNYFKNELMNKTDDHNVRLFLNTLEEQEFGFNSVQPTNFKTCKDIGIQISEEMEADELKINNKKRSFSALKIRTPETINEINIDSRYCVTSTTDDGVPVKKRKLAGPKSITKKDLIQSPPTLLECALQKINEQIYDGTCYNLDIKVEEYNSSLLDDSFYFSINESFDVDAPVYCNYCMKGFHNSYDLSKHEVGHIKVDIGPRLERKEYAVKYKKYYAFYADFLRRMEEPEEEGSLLQYEEDENDTNLLIPVASTANQNVEHVFEVINNEITVNGIPLQNIDKQERRAMYKTIIVDGMRKKFCTICRHTFKDNWAIDIHYVNSSCQYTCKYCGMKFKFHKELFPEHLKTHEGEPCNKIFGPSDKRSKFKKRKIIKLNKYNKNQKIVGLPKIKPIKMKHLLEKKNMAKEDDERMIYPEKSEGIQPYQAYFCRKCFKVFFKIAEFNSHTQICKGGGTPSEPDGIPDNSIHSEQSKSSESSENIAQAKRPVRSCVKDFVHLNDSDSESAGSWSSKELPGPSGGYECTICSSSFPSVPSRNSHMRIHKGKKPPIAKFNNPFMPKFLKDHINEQPPVGVVKLASLNPTVARLVQNNPHLTIRKYSSPNTQQPMPEMPPQEPIIKNDEPNARAYRCTDCNNKFQNKSVLYYHKLHECIVKKYFECAFCRKKFATQDQYNTHMLYVHPE